MKKKAILVVLLSAFLLVSCAKEQEETGKPVVETSQGSITIQEQESKKLEETASTVPQTSTESTMEEKETEPEKETTEASQNIPKSTETTTKPSDTMKSEKDTGNTTGQSKPANSGSSGSVNSTDGIGNTGNAGSNSNGSTGNSTASTPHTSCTYDGGKVTKAATCNSAGVKTYTCTVCGKTKTEAVAKTSHNYTTTTTAATCTANGSTKTYCTICGDVQSETTTAATGHNMVETWWPSGPTCTSGGSSHYNLCSNCGHVENLPPSAPLGHVPDAGTVVNSSTCNHEGTLSHVCTRCGCELPDTRLPIDPNNHYWATDDEGDYCARCGATR